MTVPLPENAKRLLDGATFVTLATVNPDGAPQSSVVWAKRDGDDLLMSTVRGRRKEKNMSRDPRVSVSFFDPANPYTYYEVRGSVTLTDDGGPDLIQELSHKYTGGPYTRDTPDNVRVVVRLTPSHLAGMGG